MYTKSNEPYYTLIRLWDNAVDNLLCDKYDPLLIGIGEVGMNDDGTDDNNSSITTSSASPTRVKKRKGNLT